MGHGEGRGSVQVAIMEEAPTMGHPGPGAAFLASMGMRGGCKLVKYLRPPRPHTYVWGSVTLTAV